MTELADLLKDVSIVSKTAVVEGFQSFKDVSAVCEDCVTQDDDVLVSDPDLTATDLQPFVHIYML